MQHQYELWRCKHQADAYTDQTGLKHHGTVVYEQIIVTETGARFDVDDGYSVHKDHGRIAVAKDGRTFKLWAETVSYSGGTHVQLIDGRKYGKVLDTNESQSGIEEIEQEGWWRMKPYTALGYCYPDGTAPVVSLTSMESR